MSKSKKALGVILLLVIYVVIAIAGFLVAYYVKTNFISPQKEKETTAPSPTEAPAKNGFKLYENKEQKYSLQYPQDLQIKQNSIGFGVSTVELRSPDNLGSEYVPDIQILTVPKTIAKTIGQDFESFYAMDEGSSKKIESPLQKDKGAQQFTKVRNREINGLRALDYSSVPTPNPDKTLPEIGTFVEAGNNLIIFATDSENKEQLEEVLKTFNYNQ